MAPRLSGEIDMQTFGVLIPALNPDQKLIDLLRQLLVSNGPISTILIVDDGSSAAHQLIFKQIESMHDSRLHVLHHDHNRGKGAALKTGFQFYLDQATPVTGIATMDSDGQHTVAALEKCLTLAEQRPGDLVIGARKFTEDIPFRSRFGNLLTDGLVRLITHQTISDTQTGLRVIPMSYVHRLVDFPGERFEFEFDMLLEAKKYHVTISEQPIPTIYLDGNSSSHFRVIRDSVAIYSRFLKFSASGLMSFLVDIGLFTLLMSLIGNHSLRTIMVATVIARLLSAIVNYLLNRHMVFGNAGEQTLLKYGALLAVQTVASGYLTHGLTVLLPFGSAHWAPTVAKMLGDFCLFLISYYIQKNLIFKEGQHV